eukprot:m.297550 g.297550  ORF g.297550 m.297550 type:complete len:117 (-) comp16400_c0_seq23:1779-2129(-)
MIQSNQSGQRLDSLKSCWCLKRNIEACIVSRLLFFDRRRYSSTNACSSAVWFSKMMRFLALKARVVFSIYECAKHEFFSAIVPKSCMRAKFNQAGPWFFYQNITICTQNEDCVVNY